MASLLFVGNDPRFASDISFLLAGEAEQWNVQVAFSRSGLESLLQKTSFEVIVIDASAVGTDSHPLMSELARRCPNSHRIVLVLPHDMNIAAASFSMSDYVLAKPCNYHELVTTIHRAQSLRGRLQNNTLTTLLTRIKRLPSFPAQYAELTSLLSREDVPIKRISSILEQDPAMVLKILQIANSPFFAFQRTVANIQAAVTLLGIETVRTLVLAHEVFSKYERFIAREFSMNDLLAHSLAVGRGAREIAARLGFGVRACDEAFAAGMLHDFGKLLLMNELPVLYRQVLTIATQQNLTLSDAESKIFHATHAEVGAFLLDVWNLPDRIVEAVAFHHDPGSYPGETPSILTAVCLANEIEYIRRNKRDDSSRGRTIYDYADRVGIGHFLEHETRV